MSLALLVCASRADAQPSIGGPGGQSADYDIVIGGNSVLHFDWVGKTVTTGSGWTFTAPTFGSIRLSGSGITDVCLFRSTTKTLTIDSDCAGTALSSVNVVGTLFASANVYAGTLGGVYLGAGTKTGLIDTGVDGTMKVALNSGMTGFQIDARTADTFTVNNLAGNALGTMKAGSYSLALTHANPADQTGNGTATLKMNGLGAAAAPCTITPTSTGRVVFNITGNQAQNTSGDGVTFKLVYGSGAAPANAAAASGTAISAVQSWTALTGQLQVGFAIESIATSLTLATAYWYDLQIADVTGGTASVKNIDCTAHEL